MSAPITKADLLEVAARLGSKIDGVDAKVDGVDAKVDGVDAKVAGVDAKVAGLDAKVAGLDAKVDGVDAKVDGVDAKVAGLDAKVAGLDAKVAGLDGKVAGLDGKVEGLDSKIDRVEHSLRRDMALGFDQARAERERFDGALNAKIDKRHSDTVSRMDAFMSQTLAARNDQSILIHRVDKLEERVDRLESGK